jgi:hypothetical protein
MMGLVFTPVLDALPSTLLLSNVAVVSGLTVGTKTVQIVGATGEMSIDGGGWVTSGVVQNGTSVQLRATTPAGELGQVTTVTVDLQSVGYVYWTATNRNNVVDEAGTGGSDVFGFSVAPGSPIGEAASAFDTLIGSNYSYVKDAGTGVDSPSYVVTTGVVVQEAGTGAGSGFSSPGEIVESSANCTDTLYAVVFVQVLEAGTGADTPTGVLHAGATLYESGRGADRITPRSSVVVYEAGSAAEVLTDTARVVESLLDVGEGVSAVFDGASPTYSVLEFGTGTEAPLPTNNVSINYDNVGYGYDEALLSYPDGGAWVFNARTMAVSRWEGLQVTEVHEAGGVVYGLALDGMYTQSSSIAAVAGLESGMYDFGAAELKRMRLVYLSYAATKPLVVGMVQGNGAGRMRVLYGRPAFVAASPIPSRVKIGRGPLARYWGVTLGNTLQGMATIKDVRLEPLVTSRRV